MSLSRMVNIDDHTQDWSPHCDLVTQTQGLQSEVWTAWLTMLGYLRLGWHPSHPFPRLQYDSCTIFAAAYYQHNILHCIISCGRLSAKQFPPYLQICSKIFRMQWQQMGLLWKTPIILSWNSKIAKWKMFVFAIMQKAQTHLLSLRVW